MQLLMHLPNYINTVLLLEDALFLKYKRVNEGKNRGFHLTREWTYIEHITQLYCYCWLCVCVCVFALCVCVCVCFVCLASLQFQCVKRLNKDCRCHPSVTRVVLSLSPTRSVYFLMPPHYLHLLFYFLRSDGLSVVTRAEVDFPPRVFVRVSLHCWDMSCGTWSLRRVLSDPI